MKTSLSLMNELETKKRGKRMPNSTLMRNIRLPRSFVSLDLVARNLVALRNMLWDRVYSCSAPKTIANLRASHVICCFHCKLSRQDGLSKQKVKQNAETWPDCLKIIKQECPKELRSGSSIRLVVPTENDTLQDNVSN